jgi:hypothetical protein
MQLFEREWSWASKPLGQPWHSILLGVFAVVLLAACAYGYKSTHDLLRSAHRSTGVVVDVRGDPEGASYPHVRFVDSIGQAHEFDSKLKSQPPRYSVGEQVSVLYLPDTPENARIEGFFELWLFPLITGVIGLSLSVAAILLWVFRDKLFGKNR